MKNMAVGFKKKFEERILPLRFAQGQDDEFSQNNGFIPRQAGAQRRILSSLSQERILRPQNDGLKKGSFFKTGRDCGRR